MGKNKYIESEEKMLELFELYYSDVKKRPFLVKDWVGKDPHEVYREKERPLTMEGFRIFCFKLGYTIKHYFDNTDNRYDEYSTICTHIKDIIRDDQISGGMAGVYNPSITQRLNGLVDKTETEANLKVQQITGMKIE